MRKINYILFIVYVEKLMNNVIKRRINDGKQNFRCETSSRIM